MTGGHRWGVGPDYGKPNRAKALGPWPRWVVCLECGKFSDAIRMGECKEGES